MAGSTRLASHRGNIRANGRRRKSRRGDRQTRLSVERLEDRAMLTIIIPLHFGNESDADNNGQGLQNPRVNLIFAGNWTPYAASEQGIINAATSIVNGPYLSGLRQYSASGTATMGAVGFNTTQFIPTLVNNSTNTPELQSYIDQSIANFALPIPGPGDQAHAPIYVVILNPADWALSNAGTVYGGFNDVGGYSNLLSGIFPARPINMALVSTTANGSNNVSIDGFTPIFSHELAERVVNDAQRFHVSSGEAAASNGTYTTSENVQVCDGEMDPTAGAYLYRLNGFQVQAYWSDADHAAIVPDVPYYSSVESVTLSPTWSSTAFLGRYDLTVNLPGPIPVSFSAVAGGGVAVTYFMETATFDAVTDPLNSITVNGALQLTVDDSNDASPSAITVGNMVGNPGWGSVSGLFKVGGTSAPGAIDFPYAFTPTLEIDGSHVNGSLIGVAATGVTTNVVCYANATTSVRVGSGFAGAIQGTLNISSQGSLFGVQGVTITIDDSRDAGGRTVNLENRAGFPGWGDFRSASVAPGQINYLYASTLSLTLLTSAGNGNVVNVLETGVQTDINGQSGVTSTVQIGDSGGTQNILGGLAIEGPTNLLGPNPAATIVIDDKNDTHARIIQVENSTTDSTQGVVVGAAPVSIYYGYRNASSLTIDTSSTNNNVVDILQDGVTTNLNSFGNYTATVNIGESNDGVQSVLADLNIANSMYAGAPTVAINVDDLGDNAAARSTNIGNLSNRPGWGFISTPGPASINYQYSATTSLTFSTNAFTGFPNAISVLENAVPTYLVGNAVTYVYLGDGTVGAQSILGSVYIRSSEAGRPDAGNMFITVNDLADTRARTATVTTFTPKKRILGFLEDDSPWGSISGLTAATATINYEYLDTNNVLIDGSAADQIVDNQTHGVGATPISLNDTPVITSMGTGIGGGGPASGPLIGGTILTITGTHLDNASLVRFGHTEAYPVSFLSDTSTEIQLLTPASAAGLVANTVDVRVVAHGFTSMVSQPADQFNYVPLPVVSSVGPNVGPLSGGNTVEITGSHLANALEVDFGGATNSRPLVAGTIVSNTDGIILVNPPPGVGVVDVTVTTAGGVSLITLPDDEFNYTIAPVVAAVSAVNDGSHIVPPSGPLGGGTTVYIFGPNLASATRVYFGSTEGTIVHNYGREIVATSPAGVAGTVDVTAYGPSGTSATSANDKFIYLAAPVLVAATVFPFSAVTPDFGPYEGGTTVTITGANLAGATKVNFGTIAGTIVSDTGTQIVAVSPGQALGTIVDVTVTTAGGTSATLFGDLFNYTLVAPMVSGVSPPSGPVAGGNTVYITGANLLGATEIDFGATAGTIVSDSPTQIVARSPAESAGSVDVTVVTPGERSAISANDKYTYSASIVPIVSSLSPSSGLVAGGTTVTITGTNLSGATAVDFGPTAGTITFVSATEIDATSPARAAGTVDVTVVTPNGTSATSPADQFTYQVPTPVVSSISPASGTTSGGTSVTISGSNLSGATAVEFGQTAGTITSDTATQIVVTSPPGTTGPVDVTVVTAGGTSALSPYDQFNYGAAPTISALIGSNRIPNLGPSNTRGFGVLIFGGNLAGVTEVDFGAVAAPFLDTRDAPYGYIFATTPSEGPGTVDVRVVSPSGTSAITPADQFTFTAAPFITNVANTGTSFGAGGPLAGGTSVTIQGSHLSDVTAVNFGNTPAASFTYDSYYATIVAVSPPGAAGTVSVTVTSPEGTSPVAPALDQFTYYAIPTVSGISPASGPLAGGNSVLITGTNLLGAAVYFGGIGTYTVGASGTDTSILVAVPAGASPGTVDVTVNTGGGTSATSSADQYTYLTPPVISGLSATAGPVAGGTTVTISGTGFAGATAVDFGPNNPAAILSDTDGQIVVTSPATNNAGTVDVTVTTLNGPSIKSPADQFTYEGTPEIFTQDPYSGPVKGGTLVTLNGISLANASAVDFGANPGTIISDSDQQIVVLTPEATGDAAGTVSVTVVTQYGLSPSGSFAFTYVLPPVITGVNPSVGSESGGTSVTVSGSNLSGVTAVDFGSTPATILYINYDGSIQAYIPPGAGGSGTVDVTVVTPGGTSATSSADQFTYEGRPTVSVISPVAGPIAGGTQVTITSTGLAGATRVDFNDGFGDDMVGTIISDTSGQIVVTSPSFGLGGTFDVTVTTLGGTSATSPADQFTYVGAPSVSGISPGLGNTLGSNIVTINGANLGGATAVDFGPNAGTILYDSANQIQVVSPAGAVGSVDVTVVAPGGTSPTSSADRFLYVGAPQAMADSYTVIPDTTLNVAAPGVLANDSDPQGLPLTAEVLANPLHGTLSFNSDGSFSYTPYSGYQGADSFVYQADNGTFTSEPTLVSLTIGTQLTVTTAADSGPGSLRQAILDANGTPGMAHTIQFELPAGPQTINLLTPLPAATDPLTVSLDGTQNVTVALSSASAWNNINSLTLSGAGNVTLIGGIEGPGNLTVNAGSLTANHIVQGALVIGGTADAPAMVTIAASDASGNPLALTVANSANAVIQATSSSPQLAAPIPACTSVVDAATTVSATIKASATALPTPPIRVAEASSGGGSSTSPGLIDLQSSSQVAGNVSLANSVGDGTKWSASLTTAVDSSSSDRAISPVRQVAIAANGNGGLLHPDAVAAAFDDAGSLEWVVSTLASRPSTADADISLMADELLEAIGQQWRN